MSQEVNHYDGAGYLVDDTPILTAKSGEKKYARYTVGIKKRKRPDGTEPRKTWIKCIQYFAMWEPREYLGHKGDFILVIGEAETNTWKDKAGKNHADTQFRIDSSSVTPKTEWQKQEAAKRKDDKEVKTETGMDWDATLKAPDGEDFI